MKSKKLYHFSCVFLCLAFWQISTAAQTPAAVSENTAVSTPKSEIDLIHAGDLIDVDVVGSLEYDWRGTLNPEGFLDGASYTENPIYALCRSEESVAESVAKAYEKILRAPKVVVRILDRSNRPLAILYGAVKTPQRFQIKRAIFLNELIIISGGLTDKASGEIQIFRQPNSNCGQPATGDSKQAPENGENRERFVAASKDNKAVYINIRVSDLLSGKKEANPQILSGDIVTVRQAELIYVIGGVANPKQISSRGETTLSRAIAGAGGIAKNGAAKKITIYRREAGETKIIEADLDAIKTGKTEDIALRAFDIVEVAQTGRGKEKFTPVVKNAEQNERDIAKLPLRIID